jgi:glycosyltransferase involved in cell wall biosynthesis
LGWLEPEETKSLYRKSHVLIHPSPVHDPFPNAVLEAMAAGLVVVGSDMSGSAVDRIEHGINGLLHRAGDVQELSEQLICLLTQPDRIAEMGRQARETAECWPMERAVATIENMVL